MAISNATRKRIEEGLRNWNKADSDARHRFETAERPWKNDLQSMGDAIAKSEQITQDDLAIRINARN